jgi:hypothetical protein
MIILGDKINMRIKNSVFIKKKEKYKESRIMLLSDVLSKDSW